MSETQHKLWLRQRMTEVGERLWKESSICCSDWTAMCRQHTSPCNPPICISHQRTAECSRDSVAKMSPIHFIFLLTLAVHLSCQMQNIRGSWLTSSGRLWWLQLSLEMVVHSCGWYLSFPGIHAACWEMSRSISPPDGLEPAGFEGLRAHDGNLHFFKTCLISFLSHPLFSSPPLMNTHKDTLLHSVSWTAATGLIFSLSREVFDHYGINTVYTFWSYLVKLTRCPNVHVPFSE